MTVADRVIYEAQEQTLKQVLGVVGDIKDAIGPDGLDQYVYAWLDEHGATVGYTVSGDGDLSITLS